MSESIKKRINALANKYDAGELRKLFEAARADLATLLADVTSLVGASRSYCMSDAGLIISGTNTKVKAAKAFAYMANGTVVYKPADTDMAALTDAVNVADGKSAGWAFYGDSAGTLTVSARTADVADAATAFATIGAVAVPAGKALIGFLVVSTAGAAYDPGTTALDAGTVTDLYISIVGTGPAAAAQTSSATLIA